MKADVYLWLPLYVALILQREAVDPLSLQDESVRYLGSTNLCLSNVMTVSCSKNLQSLASSRQLLQEFNRFAEFNISLPLLDVQLRNVINVAEPQWNVSSGNLLLSHHCDLKQSQRQWPNIASKSELSNDHKRSKVKCKWSASRSLYYNNSTASFNILTCGDVHPQPGPNLRMESKPKKKTSRESINPLSKRQTANCQDSEKTIRKNQQSVQCTICLTFVTLNYALGLFQFPCVCSPISLLSCREHIGRRTHNNASHAARNYRSYRQNPPRSVQEFKDYACEHSKGGIKLQ